MANDPCDRKRENKLNTGCRILIDIHDRENEVKMEIYSKVLNEGKQKSEHKAW